ncbi:dna mismatch repair protein msh6 [Quercus suber]|uniref:Dna mismatch repair protein msh6 n=1 Tax=Quercus suber TaxID=58331 RepID=A0AAW0KQ39_QUESU
MQQKNSSKSLYQCYVHGVCLPNIDSKPIIQDVSYLMIEEVDLEYDSITYVTIGKEAYLLEGFFRHWTPSIKKLLGELSQAESEKESKLKSILQRLIGQLDVLISLAIASEYYEGPTSRPIILDSSSPYEVPCFSAKNLGHLVLRSDSLGKGTFVPNEIMIGGFGHASFILLIGPNMGGWESTLLRQVGADVPTDSFELSPVDRIFVQMGAKDHIMVGQSTFLTELSETALMLLYNILSTRCSVEECFLPTITD